MFRNIETIADFFFDGAWTSKEESLERKKNLNPPHTARRAVQQTVIFREFKRREVWEKKSSVRQFNFIFYARIVTFAIIKKKSHKKKEKFNSKRLTEMFVTYSIDDFMTCIIYSIFEIPLAHIIPITNILITNAIK